MHLLISDGKLSYYINIKDIWDARWAKGVTKKVYITVVATYPYEEIKIF